MRSLRRWSAYPITTRHLTVSRVVDLTPGMRRVTLTGAQLSAHTADNGFPVAEFRSDGFDDEFKLIVCHPDADAPIGPSQRAGVLDWPNHPHAVMRTYSIRRWDAAAREVDIDLVLHGNGPGTTWARTVKVGDSVQIAGPKSSGSHPAGADWSLIAGDETALPAIARWLEEFPADGKAQVFIEIGAESHRQELSYPPGVSVQWLCRDGAPAGTVNMMEQALRAASWWEGTVFAWVAGEARTLAPIRRWLRTEKNLPAEQVEVTGYWRLGDDAAELADGPAQDGPAADIHELSDLIPAVALGVATTVGLGPVLSCGPVGLGRIVTETGCDTRAMAKLLRYLASIGVVRMQGKGYGCTYEWSRAGQVLGEEDVADALRFDGHEGVRTLGILGLLETVRTGREAADRGVRALLPEYGGNAANLLRDKISEDSQRIGYLADPLTRSAALADITSVCVVGMAAGELARQLLVELPKLSRAGALVAPEELEVTTQLLGNGAVEVFAGQISCLPTGFEVVLLVNVLAAYPDEQAADILSTAASRGKVVLVSKLIDTEALNDHVCGDDLIGLVHGEAGVRSAAELDALINRTGLKQISQETVGWGFDVRVLS